MKEFPERMRIMCEEGDFEYLEPTPSGRIFVTPEFSLEQW